MTRNVMRRVTWLSLLLAMVAASNFASAQEKVHGANSLFVASTIKIGWVVQKGASEDTTLVVMRVVNSVGQYRWVSLDGVDPFSNKRKTLVSARTLSGSIDLSVPRSGFAEFPSCEIHLYRTESAVAGEAPTLTVYYLGVPDTTPEFASAKDAEAYLAKVFGQ